MGIASSVEDKAQTFLLASKLLDIRQQKKQVEMQQSMQLAATRERLMWIAGYYCTVGLLSLTRLVVLRRFEGKRVGWDMRFLPVNQLLICMPPFMMGYQLHYAAGGKIGRLWQEADSIRNSPGPHHWFNQPILLPPSMRGAYDKLKVPLVPTNVWTWNDPQLSSDFL